MLGTRRNSLHVRTKDLSDTIYARGLAEGSPERSADVLGGVNTQTIDAIFLHESTDPRVVCADHRRVFGVNVGQGDFGVAKPALFNTCAVAPVDRAIMMVLRF